MLEHSTDHRRAAHGQRGMAVSSQPLASAAGLEILREGGTAVDAAIAMNAMLAVTEPYMCGPGGDLFALVWAPQERRLWGLNASGRSAGGRTLAQLRALLAPETVIPIRGAHCVTTPGVVDGWCTLHARFGRLPLPRVLGAAIAAAREGYEVAPVTARGWAQALVEINADVAVRPYLTAFNALFAPVGRAPAAGARQRNGELADTFELIASEGREGFYRGELAQRLVAATREAGGALQLQDLAGEHARWVSPLATPYRGYEVHALPPNGQGACVLQMLNLLSAGAPPANRQDAAWWHWFIEAKKLAFADRARYYADPDFSQLPVSQLLTEAYTQRRAALIDPARAAPDFPPGLLPGSDTTYFAVADAEGMLVSAIQSIFNPFGSALVVPGGGFALQSRGTGFALDPAHPNAYAPGKRPFHTLMPGFVTRAGVPRLAFGCIGADMQPQGQVQVLANLFDFGYDVQQAGALPRLRHVGGAQPNGEHAPSVVWYEPQMPGEVLEGLALRGHVLREITPEMGNFVGGYQGILYDPVSRAFSGGSDPRFDGLALGC